ncbi:MAG: transposase [Verrucomicrobiales bacterium]
MLQRCPQMHTLVINADNGPECSGRRKQWLYRLVEFSRKHQITIKLAYYPPYHSKYNPIERCWGVLENHWRGELLTSIEKTLGLARSMTYAGANPIVKLVKKLYQNGVTLTDKALAKVEEKIERLATLEDWFLTISHDQQMG